MIQIAFFESAGFSQLQRRVSRSISAMFTPRATDYSIRTFLPDLISVCCDDGETILENYAGIREEPIPYPYRPIFAAKFNLDERGAMNAAFSIRSLLRT